MMPLCHQLLQLAERARQLHGFLSASEQCIGGNLDLDYVMIRPSVPLAEKVSVNESRPTARFPMAHTQTVPEGPLFMDVPGDNGIAPEILQQIADMTGRIAQVLHRNISTYEHLRMYKTVFETTGTGTIIIEQDMTITCANARFQEMTGYTREEIHGKKRWSEFIVPEDRDRMQQYHYGRRKPGNKVPTEYECRITDRHGRIMDIYMKVGVIPETQRSIASFLDITTRKQAENSLRQRESQLNAIIENFEGFIFIYTRDLRVRYMNRLLTERIGMDATGALCEDALPGLESLFTLPVRERVFSGETLRMEIECTPTSQWFYAVSSPIFDSSGFVDRIQVMLIDVTLSKMAEAALKEREATLQKENKLLRSGLRDRYKFGNIIGKSPKMQDVYDLILKAAASSANVIILGESGTGKELVAQAIHQLSSRKDKAFVVVNCGAIPENLMESEFFGHVRGAFTGAVTDKKGYMDMADGGTLFLDEIGELPLSLQVKLLRALEGGGYTPVGMSTRKDSDVRILAATNRDLRDHVRKNLMREDFFYRIHIIPILLPPLRKRLEDIPLLIDHFVKEFDTQTPPPPISARLMEAFSNYSWPGNVRELQNTLHRYLTLGKIDFPGTDQTGSTSGADQDMSEKNENNQDLKEAMDNFERALLLQTLKEQHWHKGRTAEVLGIHRKTLFTKLRQHGIG
ncbi:sigma 54-interacting transcriptional regulator [Desulfobotulus sp. H1]|uniref:Sigma 54-interacting transcriptional regulator n=1 Tax=Desulfobotulus pelophilus TaxID=2823377 RepID=A0ABT3NA24_9BACT|nr:sigma 54-interacting transcriptional regulator [Desulfobotulus pelophilus]MCW7754312.1 sigma 54-interacting transcriptional regulator [Desulfobotulus pelophilus]